MPQTHVSVVPNRGLTVIHGDFVSRSRIVPIRHSRTESESIVWNRILWLAKNGRLEEAERYMEQCLERAAF